MKLSYNWLKEYLKTDLSPLEVAEAMTSIGIEVDSIIEQEEIPGGLAGVVVAEVVECKDHPDSDHLHITKLNDGGEELVNVVCGAPNVAVGQKVLFARIGTVLPGDFKIKKSKIRGVESFGMICAEDELGIGQGHDGIMVLPETSQIGMSAKEYLNIKTEAVIEYEITANRVDAASHIGVARDLYAYLKLNNKAVELKYPNINDFKEGNEGVSAEGELNGAITIDVKDKIAIPRYDGITIENITVKPSPEWLQKRLISIGLNPINNIVDISNYVLFELGQPLHIFDADKIKGNKIIVRKAVNDELLKTLDGVERKLKDTDIIIADKESPMCLAGIFGGEYSGVTETTKNIFIESAYFDPGYIRKSSKVHGLQTDASFRFERGANPSITDFAAKRAANLVLELAGGKVLGKIQEFYPNKIEKHIIDLDYNRIERFIGKKIGHSTIELILKSLAYDFVSKTEGGAKVAAPLYMVDVTRECDVVEEILRIYGYNNIELPSSMKMSVSPTPNPDPEAVRNNISNFLSANGFVETMNNSLTKKEYYSKLETYPETNCVTIVNPLSSDLNVMRQTLLLNGLEVIAYNVNRQISTLRTFEYGSVYQKLTDKDPKTLAAYKEHTCFSIFMSGNTEKSWRVDSCKGSYFELKGYLELLLRRYNIDIYTLDTDSAPADIFAEGMTYKLPGTGKVLAVMGTINPKLAKKFDVKQPVFAAEIDWEVFFSLIKRVNVKFKELPRFPEVRRDLALLIDESVCYADLRRSGYRVAKKLLKNMSLFDVYRGDKIPQGKKQYGLSFILQDMDKTLTDNEVEKVMKKLLSTFQNEYGATLR